MSTNLAAAAPEIAGSWFTWYDDPNIGREQLTFTFEGAPGEFTGSLESRAMGQTRRGELFDIALAGDQVTFSETFVLMGNPILIVCTGSVSGDEMPLTRKVGEFATQELTATRVGSAAHEAALARMAAIEPPTPRWGAPPPLGPDDVPAFAPAPGGFDRPRDDIAHGKLEYVAYPSSITQTDRPLVVYLPPGYAAETPLPVLYLLHGIGEIETGWSELGAAATIFDNLIADGEAEPMIVVMPNGRADAAMTPQTPIPAQVPAFFAFERELVDDVVPFVEAHFAAMPDRAHRAIAGLSIGGTQTLHIGLGNVDTFAWIGAFSCSPSTRPMASLIADPAALNERLRLLFVSCGDRDFILESSQTVHRALEEMGVAHLWHIDSGGHEWPVWKNDLYLLSRLLFRME